MPETFEISRVFAAPRARVWQAWTEPDQMAQWFVPKGSRSHVLHCDLRPGGFLHTRMEGPDGSVMWGKNTYEEVDAPSRLVWVQGFSNAEGDIVPAPFPMPWPLHMRTTVDFADDGEGTRVTLTWQPVDATEEQWASFRQMMESMHGGWTGSFDQLDAFLAQTG